ncbi:MAG: DUF695 domain-containing protein [Stenotrophomonas sp.]
MSKLLLAIIGLFMTTSASAQEWATAVSRHQAEDRSIVFRYVKSFSVDFRRSKQPDRVILVWDYQSESGMPSADERKSMDELEDAISPTIESNGFATLALVSTGENSREWIYYTKSQDEFMTKLNSALKDSPAFPIKIHAAPDPAWSTYEEFISGVVPGNG